MNTGAELVLRVFILDYFNKAGLNSAAEAFRQDHLQKAHHDLPNPPFLSRNPLLSEWFGMFWDVFSTRLDTRLQKNRWQQQQHLQHVANQQQQQQNPQNTSHPSRNPHQQQHPIQSSPASHQQHHLQQHHFQHNPNIPQQQPQQPVPSPSQDPTLSVAPTSSSQPTQPSINPNLSVDQSTHPQNQQLQSASHTHVFANHRTPPVQHPSNRRQQPLNPHSYRNNPAVTPQALHEHQKLQQQAAIVHGAQRPTSSSTIAAVAAAASRMRSAADSRRAINQSQLARSLTLEGPMQRQKSASAVTIPTDQPSNPLTSDVLDSTFDHVFPPVANASAPARTNAAAAAAAAANATSSRAIMQQMAGRAHSAQVLTGTTPAQMRSNGANVKAPRYAGLPIGSEAPSSASRRGASMDLSVNASAQYGEAAVVDESQPRSTAAGNTPTSKKRQAQTMSRKHAAASAGGQISPRAYTGEGTAATKRQRTGVYQGNPNDNQVYQQLQQQVSRGLAQRGRSAQFLAMQQQRQQPFSQGVEQVNSTQFLSQISAGGKGNTGRNLTQLNGRNTAAAGPPAFSPHEQQALSQRDFLQAQMVNGRRVQLSNMADRTAGDGGEGRASSGMQKGDPNFTFSQAAATQAAMASASSLGLQDGSMAMNNPNMISFLDSHLDHINNSKMNLKGSSAMVVGLTNVNGGKKMNTSNGNDGSGKDSGHGNRAVKGNDIRSESQLSIQASAMKEEQALRMRPAFGRDDLMKRSSPMQISDQNMSLVSDKRKSDQKIGTGSKANSSRPDSKRNSTSRAMKTIETNGGTKDRSRPDTSSKTSALNGSTAALGQTALGSIGTNGKREKMISEEAHNRDSKNDRQTSGSRGGGTPSQKSNASGGSRNNHSDARGNQGSMSNSRRGRGRTRGRGSGSRRSRAERGPPRASNGGRSGGSAAARSTALDQKATSTSMQMSSDSRRAVPVDAVGGLMGPPRGASQNLDSRGQNQTAERSGRGHNKRAESQNDGGRSTKRSFETVEDPGNTDQQSTTHIPNESGALMEMLSANSVAPGRSGTDVNPLDQVGKSFNISNLGLVGTGSSGKVGAGTSGAYPYDMSSYLNDDEGGISTMFMSDNLDIETATDFEEDNLLGVGDPSDLGMTGRNRG